jgi:perosamine synthetase
MKQIIPVSEPLLDIKEETYILDCVRTGWISSEGKYVKRLEDLCSDYCGVKHGIAVNTGTAALQVALSCLELEKGSEVIMPSFTIISCAIAVIEAGAVPVLVDSDPETWTMNVQDIESRITPKTKAIMAVHIYGHPVDMDPLLQLAKKHGLYIIEDVAEGHGAEYKGKKCGSLSDISIFSFYANKLVTTGEGGMVLTNSDKLAARAVSLRNLFFNNERRFIHEEIGHNYRLSNLQAAVGCGQFEKLEQFIDRKREVAYLYNEKLKDLPLQLPIEKEWAKNIYWMYSIVLEDEIKISPEEIAALMLKEGIQTRPFFIGMHEQPVFKKMGLFLGENYPVCEKISRRGFYLPSGQAITNDQIETVCVSLENLMQCKGI